MDLSPTHIHLLLNHFPTVGFIIGLGLFVGSVIWKSEDVKRAALIVFVGIAIITIPTYTTGSAAEAHICGPIGAGGACTDTGLSRNLIEQHEAGALLALALMVLTGGVAWLGLWKARNLTKITRGTTAAVFVLALLTFGAVSKAASIGGEIRHPEIHVTQDSTAPPLSRVVGNVVRDTPWIWISLEALHFVGLTLIIGVVLLVNVRAFGALRSVSFAAIDRLLPWGILGFGLNTASGMLFFFAAPDQYVGNPAFYWKLAFLVLAPLNTLYFTFDRGWMVEVGHDVPVLSKCFAGTALVCWVGVMFWGSMLPFIGNAF